MKWFGNTRLYADGTPGVGLLILRLVMGLGIMLHGWPKIQNAFHWMDPFPNHPPAILQGLGAAGEFFGGMGLIFGALTGIAALGVMSTMFVATLSILSRPGPHFFIMPPGSKVGSSYEDSALYFIFALTLFLTGPGIVSIDAFLFGRRGISSSSN